ncbi:MULTISPECIES: hypothetical protein [Enterococcus]|uniref:hypothetical protein n=1 Tax=Enterococcus TaxID=1350 RepID=UPI000BB02FF3|nr:hypothetical protein [Enterococcus thailandicus]ASZ07116.1 hypothetical protein CK496_04080 [Enterococcus thailandicus]
MNIETNEKLQLEYLLQIPIKLEEQLKNIYNTMSSDKWELVRYVYESEKTGCDYKNCSHANPNNGINHVYIVRERQSDRLLKVGINCYDKLLYGDRKLSDLEKRRSTRQKDEISKLIQKISDTIDETQEKLRMKLNDLEFRYRKLENSELTKKFEMAKELLTGDIGIGELKKVIKILQDIYDKYQVEYNKYIDIQNENTAEISTVSDETLMPNNFSRGSLSSNVQKQFNRKCDYSPKVINNIQVNTVLSENAATYRFLTVTGVIETIDKETEEVLKSEINRDICDPDDLLE